MIVGRLFTYLGHRYEPGDEFDIHRIPEFKRQTFVRLYGLSDRPAPRKKTKKQEAVKAADEAGRDEPVSARNDE